MVHSRDLRKRQLQQMTREAIVIEWQKATAAENSGSTVSVPLLIEQILNNEFPRTDRPFEQSASPRLANETSLQHSLGYPDSR